MVLFLQAISENPKSELHAHSVNPEGGNFPRAFSAVMIAQVLTLGENGYTE